MSYIPLFLTTLLIMINITYLFVNYNKNFSNIYNTIYNSKKVEAYKQIINFQNNINSCEYAVKSVFDVKNKNTVNLEGIYVKLNNNIDLFLPKKQNGEYILTGIYLQYIKDNLIAKGGNIIGYYFYSGNNLTGYIYDINNNKLVYYDRNNCY